MKIKTLEIENFRAFSAPASIDLAGKNLLVYGENGAGKSSIYHALHGFFSTDLPAISGHINLFNKAVNPNYEPKVTVTFDDELGATWDLHHPGSTSGDARVINASQRSSIIDYRSLLRTNFSFGDDPLNWFEVINRELMPDFAVATGEPTLRELWQDILAATDLVPPEPKKVPDKLKKDIIGKSQHFTETFKSALTSLETTIKPVLDALSATSVGISFPPYGGLTYSFTERKLDGEYYEPKISFLTLPKLDRPQLFLNEGRLTQIALAIYLAGRKAVIPAGASIHLNLLVLDDVLIGLDHSNRVPLLNLLSNQFRDWQIVLLTHDRVWYEMARTMLYKKSWKCVEVIEGPYADIPAPIVRLSDTDAPTELLNQAKRFLADSFLSASANSARSAFELKLRLLCDDLGIKVAYHIHTKKYGMDSLIGGLTDWIKDNKDFSSWDSVLKKATHYKDIVLNPQSHPLPDLILRSEVREAIHAVEAFVNLQKTQPSTSNLLSDLVKLRSRGTMTQEQALSGLSILRAGWSVALQQFCDAQRVKFALDEIPPTTQQQFKEAKVQHANKIIKGNLTDPHVPHVIKWLCEPIAKADELIVDDALISVLVNLVCTQDGLHFSMSSTNG